MDKQSKVASAVALTFLAFVAILTGLPILAAAGGGSPPGCGSMGDIVDCNLQITLGKHLV